MENKLVIKCSSFSLKKSKRTQSAGFTLIEVMVAAVILFSVIATVSMVYKGAYLTSEKSNSHIVVSGAVPIILVNIKEHIRAEGDNTATKLSGEDVLWGVQFEWQANLQYIKAAPSQFDPDLGKEIKSPEKYKLWQVILNIHYKSLSQLYKYNEISWNEK